MEYKRGIQLRQTVLYKMLHNRPYKRNSKQAERIKLVRELKIFQLVKSLWEFIRGFR